MLVYPTAHLKMLPASVFVLRHSVHLARTLAIANTNHVHKAAQANSGKRRGAGWSVSLLDCIFSDYRGQHDKPCS